jgi:hypothetical protein
LVGGLATDMTAIYRPKPLSVNELSLSALGGNLNIDTGFQPPASARTLDAKNLFDAFAVERWRQRTVLGRDIVVEIVYKGFLFPLGHRASLVKLTERRFVVVPGRSSPVAVLVQRKFLRIGKPDKHYQAEGQPNRGSRWPCEKLTILTRQTPDLVDPDDLSGTSVENVWPGGKIDFVGETTTGTCIWPRTARRRGAEVVFEMQIGDEAVPVRMPLIFVDNVAANDEATMRALVQYYNVKVPDALDTSPTKRLRRNGQPVVMAPEYQQGDTTFETAWWRVAAEGRELRQPSKADKVTTIDNTLYVRDSFMEGQDQPPFYPLVDRAKCRLKPVERLTGSGPLWAEVTYDGDYVADGFEDGASGSERDQQPEIYLRIADAPGGNFLPLDFEERGDLGGGVARPTMDVVAISRRLGPINGNPEAKPVPSAPGALPTIDRDRVADPKTVFPKGKFLGIMQLSELIAAILGIDFHPKLNEVVEYGAASVGGAAAEVRSALTDALIRPAADSVAEVQKAWTELASKRLAGQRVPSLKQIYPQIGTDLDALKASLDKAQSKDTPDAAFFDSLAAIHEAARRLARTIDNIARDPLAAAASAQVELFSQIVRNIEVTEKAVKQLRSLNGLPKIFQEVIAEELAATIDDFAAAITSPVPDVLKEAVKTVVVPATALNLAFFAEFPRKLLADLERRSMSRADRNALQPVVDALKEADLRITQVEKSLLAARAEIESIPEAARTALEKSLLATLPNTDDIKKAAIVQLAGILTPEFVIKAFTLADTVFKTADNLSTRPFDPENIAQSLRFVLPGLQILTETGRAAVLGPLIEVTCDKAKQTLTTALDALAEPANLAASLIGQRASDAAGLLRPIDPEGASNIETDAAAASAAIRGLDQARLNLKETIDKIPNVCAPMPSLLPIRLRALAEQERVVVGALERLAKTTQATITTKRLLDKLADSAPREAARALFALLAVVLDQIQALTLYLTPPPPPAPPAPAPVPAPPPTAVSKFNESLRLLAEAIKPGNPEIAKAIADLTITAAVQQQFDRQRDAIRIQATNVRARRELLIGALDAAAQAATANVVNEATRQLRVTGELIAQRVEQVIAGILNRLAASATEPAKRIYGRFTAKVNSAADAPLKVLQTTYIALDEVRTKLNGLVKNASPVVGVILDRLANEVQPGAKREDLFFVYEGEAGGPRGREQLTHEKEVVDGAIRLADPNARFAALSELIRLWQPNPAVVVLFRRFDRIRSASLRAVVVDALDLRELRNELDRIVRELVPSRATLSYDLSSEVKTFSISGFGEIFIPVKGTRLEIKTRAVIDLLNPKPPDAQIDGHMGPFAIKLLGSFDAVTLNFLGLNFRSGGGRKSGFDVRFGDFKIGEQAKFLKQLEPYVSPKGGMPPVRPMRDRPGIEASYGINLGSFGVGTLSFSNVTLNAGARLPFGAKDEAEFIVSIGRTDAPFLISSTIFGGGGYLALLANGTGFIGLETSFDYGGVFTFGFGPLTGTGQITLGLYFRSVRGESAKIGMNFMARGAANIACFGFSTSLFVRLTYQDSKMEGSATYTFSFSYGIDDIDFTFEVYVNQGGNAGQGSPNSAALDLPGMPALTQFASSDAPSGQGSPLDAYAAAPLCCGAGPKLLIDVPSQKSKWLEYRSLFDSTSPIVAV